MAFESRKLFQHDAPIPFNSRLFLLDLNGEQDVLSGRLMTSQFDQAYTDLKSIAKPLLHLYSDKSRVMHILTGSEDYTALSYSWGQSVEKHPLWLSTISCNLDRSVRKSRLDEDDSKMIIQDHEPDRNGYLMIGTNLRNYLLEYRRRRLAQFLWIDAICIDQISNTDKNNKIPMMRYYYEAAHTVHPSLEKLQDSGNDSNSLNLTTDELLEQKDLPPAHHDVWRALASILSQSWWDRLWTLQEVVMANRASDQKDDTFSYCHPSVIVVCNDVTVPWQHFDDLAAILAKRNMSEWLMSGSSLPISRDLHGLDAIQEVRTCRESKTIAGWAVDLSAVLVATRRRKATVPADMVFGMLAMLDATTLKKLALNVSMSMQEVYTRFGKFYIRNEVAECLLNHCPDFASVEETVSIGSRWNGHHETKPEREAQMPHAGFQIRGIWAIPVNRMFFARGLVNLVGGKNPSYHQYDTSDPRQISLIEDQNTSTATGVSLDKIVEIVDCNQAWDLSDSMSQIGLLQTLQWDQECFELAKGQLQSREMWLDIYARKITANRVSMKENKESNILFDHKGQVDFAAAYLQFKEVIEALTKAGDNPLKILPTLLPVVKACTTCIAAMSKRRRFFLTKTGRIGLGPLNTSVGDSLVVIFFCPTPYILRQKANNWQVIGETYVHGLMYGEALDMFDSGDLQEMKWIIE